MKYFISLILTTVLIAATFAVSPIESLTAFAEEPVFSSGESVYVAIYSNVYSGPRAKPFQLAAMLSIRNTDPQNAITILKAEYYDNNGNFLDHYIKDPVILKPLASTHFYLKEYDKRGGPGANFIVKWQSETAVNQPVIEGIMLGLASGQGLSFICPGKVIKTH